MKQATSDNFLTLLVCWFILSKRSGWASCLGCSAELHDLVIPGSFDIGFKSQIFNDNDSWFVNTISVPQ